MKKLLLLLLLTHSVVAQEKTDKVQVLLVGTYHMAGEGNFSYRNILTDARQKEVSAIVEQLKPFRPDKIFVEDKPGNDSLWSAVLADYKADKLPKDAILYANEIFQLGIRLAARLDQTKIYPVNFDPPNPYDPAARLMNGLDSAYNNYLKAIYSTTKNIPEEDWYSADMKQASKEMSAVYKTIPSESLKKTLLTLNSEEIRQKMAYTAAFANLDNDPKGMGVDVTNIQQFRNMKIFQNILHQVDANTKRIIVIYGASHNQPLRNLFEMNPRFKVLDLSRFVK
jgi:Family of unknown function (DUF5694)